MQWKAIEIDKETYCIQSSNSTVHVFLIKGRKRALLIDTGCGGKKLYDFINNMVTTPIDVVITHGHYDHISCNGEFNKIYIHQLDKQTLKTHTNSKLLKEQLKRTFPKLGFYYFLICKRKMFQIFATENIEYIKNNYTFDLGNRTIQVIHTPGHTKGSICLYEAKRKYLFTGDMVCQRVVLMNLEDSEAMDSYLTSLTLLAKLLPEDILLIPSHYEYPVKKEVLYEYLQCAKNIVSKPLNHKTVKQIGCLLNYQEYRNAKIAYNIETEE